MKLTIKSNDPVTLTQETDADVELLRNFIIKAGLYCGQQKLPDGRFQVLTTVGAVTKIALGIPLQ